MPREYGAYATAWRRHAQWSADGTLERIWRTLLGMLDEQGKLDWSKGFIDGSFVAAEKGGDGVGPTKIGRGSKVMLVTEGHGLPIGLHVDSATPHEMALVDATLRSIRVPRPGRGRPKSRLRELVADKAYDSRPFRQSLRHRGIKPTIPVVRRPAHWRPRIGRPPVVGPHFTDRWKVERANAWMDNHRRLLIRFERKLVNFRGFCLLALILWCLRRLLK